MAASITDHYIDPNSSGRPVPTTLTADKQVADGSVTCASLSGWATDTAVHFCIYETDTDGAKIAGTQSDWKGIVSGSTINTLTLTGGTDQVYPIGATVVAAPTAGWGSDLVTGLLVEHEQDGTHGDITATSVTTSGAVLTSPKVITGVNDTNGNELLKVTATSSAVNELTLANAATGSNPILSATGGDTNIGITLTPKGTGVVTVSDATGLGGAWTSWTPTFSSLSGGTLNYARYTQVGKTVHFRIKYTLAGAGISGSVSFTPPVTGMSDYATGTHPVGTMDTYDLSATTHYMGFVWFNGSATSMIVTWIDAATSYGKWALSSSTVPFIWASGDILEFEGTYEAA